MVKKYSGFFSCTEPDSIFPVDKFTNSKKTIEPALRELKARKGAKLKVKNGNVPNAQKVIGDW